MSQGPRQILGAMCGTSLDGLDVAAITTTGRGLDLTVTLKASAHHPLGRLGPALRAAAEQVPATCRDLAALARDLGTLHADAFAALIADGSTVDLAVAHGQTVLHEPPLSWQLLDPAPIAARLGCPVLFDLRRADLAAGGQGAPITPLADWILFRSPGRRRAIVNLGGFCNLTHLADRVEDVRGGDLCACNHLLDAVARTRLDRPYDEGGAVAADGDRVEPVVAALRMALQAQVDAPRSLGTGDELIALALDAGRDLSTADFARSVTVALAETIASSVGSVDDIIVAGGGACHTVLLDELRTAATVPVETSDTLGIPISDRESVAMAVLGVLATDGVSITLPTVTGRNNDAQIDPLRLDLLRSTVHVDTDETRRDRSLGNPDS